MEVIYKHHSKSSEEIVTYQFVFGMSDIHQYNEIEEGKNQKSGPFIAEIKKD